MKDESHKYVGPVKSYLLRAVVEKDEDVWRAYVPELESRGAAAWGQTKDQALRNIEEVLHMVVEDLLQRFARKGDPKSKRGEQGVEAAQGTVEMPSKGGARR